MPSWVDPQKKLNSAGCGMWYRRITEVVETDPIEQSRRVPVASPVDFRDAGFGESSTANERLNEQSRPPIQNPEAEIEAENEPISLFKRVRVISQENRERQVPAASSTIPRTKASTSVYSLNDFNVMQVIGVDEGFRRRLIQSKHNGRFYCLKILKKQELVRSKRVDAISNEQSVLRIIKHPFIEHLWGSFQDSTNLYMLTDFSQGGELFSLLRRSQVSGLYVRRQIIRD